MQRAGYAPGTARKHQDVAAHLVTYAARRGLALDGDPAEVLQAFAGHRKRCRCRGCPRGLSSGVIGATRLFLAHLRRLGVGGPERDSRVQPALTRDFAHWMKVHRGARPSTLRCYCSITTALLAVVGGRVADLDVATIRAFVLARARSYPREAGKVRTVLRALLRFLAVRGLAASDLVDAVPIVAGWRLAVLPRHLPASDVHRMVASCDARTRLGARNRAMLLLLSRLGLRAGEVTGLRLSDLDWHAGTLVVMGKSRRAERLPLAQEVGDAIQVWLRHRPAVPGLDQVFLRLRPPHGPLSSGGLGFIVAQTMDRAGVQAPSRGAHVLRHSLATDMLRRGASLQTIAALLRHRSVETTTIYAKVDVELLGEVAQPWPQGSPC
jgi:site-specific recombinase XerD